MIFFSTLAFFPCLALALAFRDPAPHLPAFRPPGPITFPTPPGLFPGHSHYRGPPPFFKTELDFKIEYFFNTTITEDRSLLTDGYIFLDPMYPVPYRGGPQIYDLEGNLVWHGDNSNTSINLHVCDYQGQKMSHLCYHYKDSRQLTPIRAYPSDLSVPANWPIPVKDFGTNVVVDQTYSRVGQPYNNLYDGLAVNGHVFQMLEGGESFLGLSDKPTLMDLEPFGFKYGPVGWVADQCISETNVSTGANIFHWCYLDSGMPIWETQTFFQSPLQTVNHTERKVGTGLWDWPWDFLHLNSVSKTPDGDYYTSFRHGNQILKIAGSKSSNPGAVLWRLGGRSNDFKLIGFDFEIPFSRQHDVRYISSSGSEETISILNNAYDGEGPPSQFYSDGQIIRIDTANMTATLEKQYINPHQGLSAGRGNMQTLSNGNIVIGWGTLPEVTEYHENGTVLYHTSFTDRDSRYQEISYRAYKFPWKGYPTTKPKLVAYSRGCGSKVVAYVSWNGATEIKQWQFHAAPTSRGPWIPAGTFDKDGFETQANLTSMRWIGKYVKVEGLDEHGHILGSVTNQTYIPRRNIIESCDDEFCTPIEQYFEPGNCEAWACDVSKFLTIAVLLPLAILIQLVATSANWFGLSLVLVQKPEISWDLGRYESFR